MKRVIAFVLCFLFPIAAFSAEHANNYKITYDGGSILGAKSSESLSLGIQPDSILLAKKNDVLITIPATSITEISYGQDVHRRIGAAIGIGIFTLGIGALMALTKSKKHFIGVTWANGDHKGGFAMQCDKNDYRGILAALEGITGKKAVDSESMTVKN